MVVLATVMLMIIECPNGGMTSTVHLKFRYMYSYLFNINFGAVCLTYYKLD